MSEEKKNLSEEEINKKALEGAFKNYYNKDANTPTQQEESKVQPQMPTQKDFESPEDFQSRMQTESDPDLIVGYEVVDLPSKGRFYKNGLDKIKIEYLTSKDEDILTTPSLIQDGSVLDVILKRKIKTPNVVVEDLLTGDKNALILFLRASSYGREYEVEVYDPRTEKPFKQTVDLLKLKNKEITEQPDENGHFTVELPMRKKIVKFRLLTSGEENQLSQRADAIMEAYNQEYSEYSTMKLKAHIVSIDGKTDRSYIEKFVDAMPVRDTITIRRKILDVSPDIDMTYKFKTKDGFEFNAKLTVGVDFFFPSL